jgi:hypothetical protein
LVVFRVVLRAGAFRAVVFRAVVFRAVVFRAVVFRAGAFRAVVFRAGAFRAGAFRVVARLVVDFLAVDFLAVDFLAVDFRAPEPDPVLRAVDFLAVDFFADPAADDFLADDEAADFFAPGGAGGHAPRSSLGARLVFTTASLNPLSGVMRAFFDALIRTGSWVCGLRPMRAGRSTLTNFAKPEIDTGSPFETTAVTTSVKPFRTESTSLLSTPLCVDTACTRSRRFTVSS